jgi:putative transposase
MSTRALAASEQRQSFRLAPKVRHSPRAWGSAPGFVAGGVADHVHIVTTLPRTVSQAQSIEQIKKASSKWIKTLDPRYRGFFWQRGYGAFSVSPSHLDDVLQYVDAQQKHHRTRTFQEEYREFLRRHGLDFDERYVWD